MLAVEVTVTWLSHITPSKKECRVKVKQKSDNSQLDKNLIKKVEFNAITWLRLDRWRWERRREGMARWLVLSVTKCSFFLQLPDYHMTPHDFRLTFREFLFYWASPMQIQLQMSWTAESDSYYLIWARGTCNLWGCWRWWVDHQNWNSSEYPSSSSH